jgi:hypothetical protein
MGTLGFEQALKPIEEQAVSEKAAQNQTHSQHDTQASASGGGLDDEVMRAWAALSAEQRDERRAAVLAVIRG